MKKPTVIEVFNDNGSHSHWALVDLETSEKLWSENPIECKAMGYPVEKDILVSENAKLSKLLNEVCTGKKHRKIRELETTNKELRDELEKVNKINDELRQQKVELQDRIKELESFNSAVILKIDELVKTANSFINK
jgi:hypothetical protein